MKILKRIGSEDEIEKERKIVEKKKKRGEEKW